MYPNFWFCLRNPDNVYVLLFNLLHGPHNRMRFDMWFHPPSARGVLWSNSR